MAFFISFEVPITLRGKPHVIQVNDHYIEDGDLDEDGGFKPDNIVFNYRVFDLEEDAEILQLTQEERAECYKAVLADLQDICDE